MPVHCERRGSKWRLIEPGGGLATTGKGNSRDGGGHENRRECEAQASAMNMHLHGKGKK